MLFNRVLSLAALAAAASSISIPAVPRQGGGAIDIDAILNQIEEKYRDPAYAQTYLSAVFAYASAAMPAGANPPSEDQLYAALATMSSIGPAMVSEAIGSIEGVLSRIPIPAQDSSALAQAMSMLHNSSVVSRLSNMMNSLIDNIRENHKEDGSGTPTAASDDDDDSGDRASASDRSDTASTNTTHSGAMPCSVPGALLAAVGAAAGAIQMLF
ncbi:hypothetical protein H4R18_000261 [Coemansia javaensis]|uniref:Uncharacterized protein n=1 Tax=Coemansia javaensis TaxID=2761396 RepID=A0A9W8LKV1_9FUNG|nr:hypothetical protein H4R18_000261 [Coemansia javaensis]